MIHSDADANNTFVKAGKGDGLRVMVKNRWELKRETDRLHEQLDDDDIIDLSALRHFWKDLDDYANAGNTLDQSKLGNFDQEITTANGARRRLATSMSDFSRKLRA
jgi:hypothetical protein